MRKILAVSCMVFSIAASLPAQNVSPADLVYLCENIPPSNYVDAATGELKGISAELLFLIWSGMGVPAQPVKVVPWARGYATVQAEKNAVLFSMTRTRERESLFKWVGPIFTVKNVLLGMADRGIEVGTLEDAKAFHIGTITGDVLETYLRDRNFDRSKIAGVSTMEQNFEKLRLGRIDLIAHTDHTLSEIIRSKKLNPKDFRIYYVLSESPNYYAFSRDVPDSLIARFQSALDGLRAERAVLLRKYGFEY